jgi:hypothetical protein
MTTSGVTTSSLTAREVVESACELIGVKDEGLSLGETDAAVGLKHLNWMLKGWQATGGKLWLTSDFTYTWPAATASVSLDPGYLRLENAFIRVSGVDRPLTLYSNSDYAALSNKSSAGTPVAYNVNRTVSTLQVRLWPVPAVNTALYADGVRIIEDVTNLNQALDVPQEWTECVFYGLAKRLRHIFPGVNPQLADEVAAEADRLFASLSSFGEEDGSLFFGPAEG